MTDSTAESVAVCQDFSIGMNDWRTEPKDVNIVIVIPHIAEMLEIFKEI